MRITMESDYEEDDGADMLTVFVGTGRGSGDEEEGEIMTYEPGEQFVVYRGMRALVDSKIEVVDESPDGSYVEADEEGLLPRGRYRWNGRAIVYVGRQKGPARPPG